MPGDQLPSVREVVTQVALSPNTVHRAYRELENLGITESRWGLGTFVAMEGPEETAPNCGDALSASLLKAISSGLSDDDIVAFVRARISAI